MRLLLPLVLMVGLAACAGSGDDSVSPDEQFGHRYEGIAPDGRETVLIEPADSSEVYIELPVFLDSVHVRSAHREALPGEAVPVPSLPIVRLETREPKRADASRSPVTRSASARPAAKLSPAPQLSTTC